MTELDAMRALLDESRQQYDEDIAVLLGMLHRRATALRGAVGDIGRAAVLEALERELVAVFAALRER